MKRTFLAALAATCVAGAAAAQDLRICVEGAYPPFSETSPSGEIVGFDIDIANALCAEMGRDCEMVKTAWDGIIPALLERKCDAIVASMSITPERQQVIDFTNRYYMTPARFVAPADADFTDSAEDMADKIVGVQRGTIHSAYMEEHYPETELTQYASQDETYLDLAAGRLDAVMGDSIAIQDGFLKTPEGESYAFLGDAHYDPEIHGVGAGIGVRKEDAELREEINAAIAAIRENGTYDEISGKYFDFDVYGE
jgi:arginine/ornithine transport system substrate-binding protein